EIIGPGRICHAMFHGRAVVAVIDVRSAVFAALVDPWPANQTRSPVLLVFAKEPTPGKVKTRLADEVGAARAAELAGAFLDDALALTAEAARENVRATVLASPPESRARFEELAGDRVLVGTQCDGDLGARLATGLEAALQGGAPKALAIGSDIPDLP